MDVDYDFCRSAKLTPVDLLIWLDIYDDFEDGLIAYDLFGRQLYLIEHLIRISCINKDFDRWANSEEICFDLSVRSQYRAFVNWIKKEQSK